MLQHISFVGDRPSHAELVERRLAKESRIRRSYHGQGAARLQTDDPAMRRIYDNTMEQEVVTAPTLLGGDS